MGLLDSQRTRNLVFCLLAFLLVLPIWIVRYPPIVDYPNHLARAFVLYHLNDPHYSFARWFASDWGPNPYFLADFLMQVLQRFLGIYTAGRVLLTLCVLSVPFSALFFLRRANPGNEYLGLWAFAIAYNPNFLMGFMSFELSIALCFVVAGVWLDYIRTKKLSLWILTLLLATLLFLTHLGGFVIAGVALAIFTLYTSRISRRLLEVIIPFLPGGTFFLYAQFHGWSGRGFDYSTWHLIEKIRSMLTPFRGYSRTVGYLILAGLAANILYFFFRRDKLMLNWAWAMVAAVILAIHWLVPDKYGDLGFIDARFTIFALLFALAIPSLSGNRNWLIAMASILILLRTLEVGIHFVSEQKPLLTAVNQFQEIPPNSLVLTYADRGDRSWMESANLHFWAYGVIDRGWICPNLFHQKSVQPLQLRVPMAGEGDVFGTRLVSGQYDIQSIARSYDYVWASKAGYLDPFLARIATPISSDGTLEIYKINRPQKSASYGNTSPLEAPIP